MEIGWSQPFRGWSESHNKRECSQPPCLRAGVRWTRRSPWKRKIKWAEGRREGRRDAGVGWFLHNGRHYRALRPCFSPPPPPPSPTPSSLCPGAEGNILVLKIIAASRLANGAVCNWKKSRLTYKNVVSNARFFPFPLSPSFSLPFFIFSLSRISVCRELGFFS